MPNWNWEDAAATQRVLSKNVLKLFLAAAKVGGIHANNTYPVEFLMSNLLVEAINVCRAAHATSVNRLIFLGSSCIYPRDCPQPIKEEYLLTGPLEATNPSLRLG